MNTQKYKVKKGFIIQKLENKTVIFDSEGSILYTFNETASFIFQKIKLGWDKEKIVDNIVKKYEVKNGQVEKDYNEIIKKLLAKQIIKELRK